MWAGCVIVHMQACTREMIEEEPGPFLAFPNLEPSDLDLSLSPAIMVDHHAGLEMMNVLVPEPGGTWTKGGNIHVCNGIAIFLHFSLELHRFEQCYFGYMLPPPMNE